MPRLLVPVLAAVILLGAAAPAAPPDYPVLFIKADELKEMLDRGVKPDIVDVRNWDAYVEMHIRGARSIPLRAVERRSGELSKTAPVVLY